MDKVFDDLERAVSAAGRIRSILEKRTRKKEGTVIPAGALSPEMAGFAKDCIQALHEAENAAVSIDEQFIKETRWVCPSL